MFRDQFDLKLERGRRAVFRAKNFLSHVHSVSARVARRSYPRKLRDRKRTAIATVSAVFDRDRHVRSRQTVPNARPLSINAHKKQQSIQIVTRHRGLMHNHPSGDPTPSAADVDMTRQVIEAVRALKIAVHDHLVVGREGVASFKALGLI